VSLETVGRQVELSLIDEEIRCQGKLVDLLKELPQVQFVRCHHAFALNINNTRTLTRKYAIAVNGKEIPVSRTFLDDTRKAFLWRMGAV
jgi:DNA-binding LytR/AlgR family response regulator